jgi:hypothetical protein
MKDLIMKTKEIFTTTRIALPGRLALLGRLALPVILAAAMFAACSSGLLEDPAYGITITESVNGSVSASPSRASAGTVITLTISADEGHQLKTLTVKDGSGADVTVSGTGTSRTFVMPASNVTVSAEFEERSSGSYSVTVNAASNGSVAADPASAEAGTNITLTISADEGHQLKTLTVKDGSGADITVSGTGTSRTFVMPASNVTVSAEFEELPPGSYSVTVNEASNGSVAADPASAEAGVSVTLTISADAGYQLKTLTVKDASNADITVSGTETSRTFTMPPSNVTVSAEFEAIVYSITVNEASHGSVTADPANAATGTSITLTISADTGYQLKTLTVKDASGADVSVSGTETSRTFTMPASNVTVSAEFEAVYSVTVNPASHGSVIADPASAVTGTSITLTISADAGHRLKTLTVKDGSGADVSVNGTGTSRTFTMPASNVTVNAEFEELPPDLYSVTVNEASHGSVAADPASAEVGTSVTLTINADTGYQLKTLTVKDGSGADVSVNGTGTSRTFVMPASNVTGRAEFEAVVYSITVNATSNGSVAADLASAVKGTSVTLTISADAGYRLKTLTVKDGSDADVTVSGTGTSRTFVMPASNVTVSAEFEAVVYSITVNGTSHGSVAADLASAVKGTSITLTISANAGYRLKTLTVKDGSDADVTVSGTGTSRTFTMPPSNVTVSAEFEAVYSVTVNGTSHGSVIANPISAAKDTSITLTISADADYQLKTLMVKDGSGIDVTVNGTGTSRTFAMPASNVTVSAEFEATLLAWPKVYSNGVWNGDFGSFQVWNGNAPVFDTADVSGGYNGHTKALKVTGTTGHDGWLGWTAFFTTGVDLRNYTALSFRVKNTGANAVHIANAGFGAETGELYKTEYTGEDNTGITLSTSGGWTRILEPIPNPTAGGTTTSAFYISVDQISADIEFLIDDIEYITDTVSLTSITIPSSWDNPLPYNGDTVISNLGFDIKAVYTINGGNVSLYKDHGLLKWYTPEYTVGGDATLSGGAIHPGDGAPANWTLTVSLGSKTSNSMAGTFTGADDTTLMLEDFESVTGVLNVSPYGYGGAAYAQANTESGHNGTKGVQFNYGQTTVDPWYAGFWIIKGFDLSGYDKITFWVKKHQYESNDAYRFQFNPGGVEVAFTITGTDWEKITIPLSDFTAQSLDLSSITQFGIFATSDSSNDGVLYVDTIMAEKD